MSVDLHTHTTVSDGSLDPDALLASAVAAGVTMLAITDHDSIGAFLDRPMITPPATPAYPGVTLIPGVELSTSWQRQGIHVLGLNIDPHSAAIQHACAAQSAARRERARQIGERLHKLGIADAYGGAAAIAGTSAIGRPHFAQHLVAIGAARTLQQAFNKFLGGRHDQASSAHWASLEQTVAWIHAAGGSAVLAHPAKYGLTHSRLGRLTTSFKAAGGDAIEIISGAQHHDVTHQLATLARRHELSASLGSDFHHPGTSWAALGRLAALPPTVTPVWDSW